MRKTKLEDGDVVVLVSNDGDFTDLVRSHRSDIVSIGHNNQCSRSLEPVANEMWNFDVQCRQFMIAKQPQIFKPPPTSDLSTDYKTLIDAFGGKAVQGKDQLAKNVLKLNSGPVWAPGKG